jgi:hypothetical protein
MSVTKYENFLPEDLYTETFNYSASLLTKREHCMFTHGYWDNDIIKDSFPVLIHDIDPDMDLCSNLKQVIEYKCNMNISTSDLMLYYWTRYSYIPWHSDAKWRGGLTIYLNQHWHPDHGGYFLYQERLDQDIIAILPKRNLGVMQLDQTPHATTPVTFDGGVRLTLQVFFR